MGIVIPISQKIDTTTRKIISNEELSLFQEDITNLNMYVPNRASHVFMRQNLTDLQGELERTNIIVSDYQLDTISTL